ncbi:MAG: DUF2807 domain-containing protein [Clostridia bacterium]|nr:DUF2807 domain-containing protein [Clostridia bacterium]
MFKLFRRLILLIIIGGVAIGGYFMFNHTKDVKGETISNTINLDITKTYTLDVYKMGISNKDAVINVYPTEDGETYIQYEVNKALVEEYGFEIKVDSDASKIDIATKHNYAYKVSKFTINIYCNFNKLILSSPLKYNVDASAIGNRLAVTYNGTGSLNISNLNLAEIDLKTTSSGKTTLSGHANNIIVESSGRGNIEAKDLITLTANVNLRADGGLTITVTTKITAVIDGKGDINYYGNAETVVTGNGEGTVFQAQG